MLLVGGKKYFIWVPFYETRVAEAEYFHSAANQRV
jgi:hypothetical protein